MTRPVTPLPAPPSKVEKQLSLLVDRINTLCLDRATNGAPKLAITITEAAAAVGMSTAQFRRVFLSGRLRCVPMGERARVIDVDELREAYRLYREQMRLSEVRK